MNRRHPASLIPFSLHNPRLLSLMTRRVDLDMVTYVARQTEKVFPVDPNKDGMVQLMISLVDFISLLVNQSNAQASTLLTTLVYFERIRLRISPMVKGMRGTPHRLFLATLIVTSKYLNDASPKNKHWAEHSKVFTVQEINIMEKQLLSLLNYDLRFDEAEVCSAFAPFMFSEQDANTRALAVDKVIRASRARAQAQDIETPVPPPPPTTPCSRYLTASLDVRGIVKRVSSTLSMTGNEYNSGMRSTLSNASTSSSISSASDMASLLDDTGSSPPSSRWNSDNSGSECSEDENGYSYRADPMEEDADTTVTLTSQHALLSKAASGTRRPFKLRPIPPSCAYKNVQFTQQRTRKVSDTSSIRTIVASPSMSSSPSSSSSSFLLPLRGNITTQRLFHRESKRVLSVSTTTSDVPRKDGIASSSTMPSIPRSASVNVTSSATGNFLSRMWGAATVGRTQSGLEQNTSNQAHSVPRSLKRLVLVHSKSTVFNRTGPTSCAVEV